MIWTAVTPELLQFVAAKERLAQKVAEVINTMITGSMDLADHITSLVSTTMDQRPCCAIWQHQPDPVNEPLEVDKLVTIVLVAVRFHCHSDTCKKGCNGQ